MWFKNLMVFTIDTDYEIDPSNLSDQLAEQSFSPCGPQEMMSIGWVSPLEVDEDELAHTGASFMLLTAKKEERLLPAGVIREELDSRVKAIESEQERKIARKERLDMRDNLVFELTPKAFRRSSLTRGLILPDVGLIVVDASSWKRAEEWLSLLRASLGSLPVRPVESAQSVSATLTGWLLGKNRPGGVEFGDECELQSPDEGGGIIRCRNQSPEDDEMKVHLKAGKQATKLAMEWQQSSSFVLTDTLEIKRFRFSDGIMQQTLDDGDGDPAAEKDAIATLMAMEFSRFLPSLWSHFGGLVKEQ